MFDSVSTSVSGKARTHTKQSNASCCHKGHAHLAKPGHLCTKQVLCAGATQSPGAGQGTHRSTNCISHVSERLCLCVSLPVGLCDLRVCTHSYDR